MSSPPPAPGWIQTMGILVGHIQPGGGSNSEYAAAMTVPAPAQGCSSSNSSHHIACPMPKSALLLPPPCAPWQSQTCHRHHCHSSSSSSSGTGLQYRATAWQVAEKADPQHWWQVKLPEGNQSCINPHLLSCHQLPCLPGPKGTWFCGRPLPLAPSSNSWLPVSSPAGWRDLTCTLCLTLLL